MDFLIFTTLAIVIGLATGRIVAEWVESVFGAATASALAAIAVTAAANKAALALLVAVTSDGTGSTMAKLAVAWDLPISRMVIANEGAIGPYFFAVLLVAPLAAIASMLRASNNGPGWCPAVTVSRARERPERTGQRHDQEGSVHGSEDQRG